MVNNSIQIISVNLLENVVIYYCKQTCSKEDEDCPIGQKCGDHRFLGFSRCDPRAKGIFLC